VEERRAHPRHRTLKHGKVVLSDWMVFDCLIRDLGEGGARLELGGLMKLPTEFRLHIASSNLLVPVALVWQHGQTAGVRFAGPGNAPHRAI
jgi:hypothetical protein